MSTRSTGRLAVLLAAIAVCGAAGPTRAQEPPTASGLPPTLPGAAGAPVLAYYYLDHEPERWRGEDTSILGSYSSDDPEVLHQHVRWAKQAGIQGFLVTWSRSRDLDRRLQRLAEVAAAEDFRLGLVLEGRRRTTGTADRLASDLEHFVATFGHLEPFHLLDRPLVVWLGSSSFSRDEVARVAGKVRGRVALLASERTPEAYRRIADLVDGNAYYWSSGDPVTPAYAERLAALSTEVRSRGGLWIAPASPGYQRVGGDRKVERRDGETLRRALLAAAATDPDFVGLVSWNDFADGTQIEPSGRFGMRSLETLALLSGGILPGGGDGGTRSVPVLAYYYIWFDARSWRRGKRDYPLLGTYTSDDAEVMRLHVRWAKQAGIDGFIVSWKVDDDLDPRLEQLAAIARAESFKLAIIYQGLDYSRQPRPLSTVERDFDSFVERFGSDPAFAIFDRPLLIWNGTWEYSRADIERVTTHRRDRLAILAAEKSSEDYAKIADLVDGDAYYWSSADPETTPGFREKLSEMGREVHARGGLWIAPAAPGFDARLIGGEQVVERRQGRTLRDSALAAMLSGPDAVGLISWNEFSENTHIEPSHDHGTRYLEVVAELRGGAAPHVDFDRITVDPGTVLIRTVPPLHGIGFALDGRPLSTGDGGTAELEAARPGVHRLELLPVEDGETRLRFTGWESAERDPERVVVVPLQRPIDAGFEVSRRISPRFVTESGETVEPERLDLILLRDSQGRRYRFEGGDELWLPTNAVVRRMSGLESVDLEYRVERVEIDGANVVNRGQQRLRPDTESSWRIELLLHQAGFTAEDALFRFRVGTGIALSFPDGRREEIAFPEGERRVTRTLPRGRLTVMALGAPGIALEVPLVLSRSQEVVALVLTWWSLGAVALTGAAVLLGLFLSARPSWRAALGRALSRGKRWYRRRSPDSAAG